MLIAGAGGFAREMMEILFQMNYGGKIFFYDDIDPSVKSIDDKYCVLKNEKEVSELFKKDNNTFCLGTGGVFNRQKLYEKFIALGGTSNPIISPYSHIGKSNIIIKEAVSIATGTVVTTHVTIETGCLINLNCTIGHDVHIGRFCELSPGVHISGKCIIGDHCSIGTGAVILPGIIIHNNSTIGAGAVVTKNVSENSTVIGVPAIPFIRNKAILPN